jgi:hypothetical protein
MGERYKRVGRPRGPYPRHVRRRDAQIARGTRAKFEWRRVTVSIVKGSETDQRLQAMKKGDVSSYVRHALRSYRLMAADTPPLLRIGDLRKIGDAWCVLTERGWDSVGDEEE